ncbi:MAG: hypothetical protein WC435_02635 [Candidatus Paceibacterota bacterium]
MDMKKALGILLILLIAGAVGYYFLNKSGNLKGGETGEVIDPLNAVYKAEGGIFSMENGTAKEKVNSMSGEAAEVKIFGQPVFGDLNQDGKEEAAVIISYKNKKGEAFYAAAAVRDKNSQETKGTNALILGEGVVPKKILIEGGKILVSYEVKTKELTPVIIVGRFRVEETELRPSN